MRRSKAKAGRRCPGRSGPAAPLTVVPAGLPAPVASCRLDGQPETDADRTFFDLRESGYAGPIDQDGNIPDPRYASPVRWRTLDALDALGRAQPFPTRSRPDMMRGCHVVPAELAGLDWSVITCQCAHGCWRPARYVAAFHAVDHCGCSGVNQDGNLIQILCGCCLSTSRVAVTVYVRRLSRRGRPACRSCGAPIAAVGDVLRSVRLQ
jgi:hypothetical protein